MQTLWQDLRYGVRMLLKKPSFTLVAVSTLALGIGANTAIFSVVNAVLLRPLPFKDADRIAWIWETQPQLDRAPFTPADFLDYQAQNRSFEQVAAFTSRNLTLTGGEQPERLIGAMVSHNFFAALGAEALSGRAFLPEDGQPDAMRVAVISYGLWQRRFGANPQLIGKSLTFTGVDFTVVGIMPPDFKYPSDAEVWLNPRRVVPELGVGSMEDVRTMRGTHYLNVIARLKPGVTIAQAESDMKDVARRLGQEHKSTHGVRVVSLHERVVGNLRPALLVLLGAVSLVLLIACANVANLLLGRAASRQKEIAVRTALGASRARVIRQLLTESLLLGLLGGGLGLLLAHWGVDLLVALSPADTPRLKEIGIDSQVVIFTLAASLLIGLIFGLAPALQASKLNLNEALKAGGRSATADVRHNRVRSLLVVCEVALSLVVLVGAGLLIKSFLRLQEVEPGFDASNLLTAQISLAVAKYDSTAKQAAFFGRMIEHLEALPGVQAVAVANDLPIAGRDQTSNPRIEGRASVPGEEPLVGVHMVNHSYFQAMGIQLLKGRLFSAADVDGSQPVAIINETMARRLFPNDDALGKQMRFSDLSSKERWKEIVGVVGNVKHNGLDAEPYMETYTPYLQNQISSMMIAVRSTSDPANLTAAVRSAILEIDKDQPISSVKMMDQVLSDSIAPRRSSMSLFGFFAAVALALATVGIYGVMSYSVTERTHEIGIRMALGAQRMDVLRFVIGQGMLLTLIGVAVGLVATFALTRVMSSLLYGVSATDPVIFIGVALLLATVALLACYIPARRATKVDPMVALRYE
ncbi:MAG: ABC transporter permease [Acidobacteriota bacterium]|nr:ABC transporter permease [Acidobacteriota bacterium]